MEIELKFANRQMISRSTEILSEIHDIKSKLTIPRNTRNSPSSFLPLEPQRPPITCAEMEHTDPNTRISHAIQPTPDHQIQPTSKNRTPEPNRPTPVPHASCRKGQARPAAAPPSQDLRSPDRLTRPPKLARPPAHAATQRNEEEVKPRTWAAKRSSSAAATAAVEWPWPRSRSTRCSCRCSAKPRSFRSDDFISAPPPRGPGSPAPDRAPGRRRSGSRSRKP